MQMLLCLHENAGRIVSRDELMAEVWGHNHVTEDALNRTIARLRRALMQMEDGTASIETVPRVGYRFRISDVAQWVCDTGTDPVNQSSPEIQAEAVRRDLGLGWPRPGWWVRVAIVMALLAALLSIWRLSSTEREASATATLSTFPLTSLVGLEFHPSLSRDGSQVAFVWKPAEARGAQHLYVQPVLGDEMLQLTRGDVVDQRPRWSPDGAWIAFLRLSAGRCDLMKVSPIGGVPRRIESCDRRSGNSLDWSPDGSTLAYSLPQPANQPVGLALLNLERGTRLALPVGPTGILGDTRPVFSPDGSMLAFVRWQTTYFGDIHVFDLKTQQLRRVTEDATAIYGLDWSPDGRWLYFSSNRAGDYSMWRVRNTGGAPQSVLVGAGRIEELEFSADGRRLVYQEWDARADIYAWRNGHVARSPLIGSTRWDWGASPSPDGSMIAFASDRSGREEIWLTDIAGGWTRRLTDLRSAHIGRIVWSADSQQLAFGAAVDGNQDIYTLQVSGGTPRRMTQDPVQDVEPGWSGDGLRLFFASRRSGDWQLWQREVDSGRLQLLTQDGARHPQWHEGALFFSRPGQDGLWRLAEDTGLAELVNTSIPPRHAVQWQLHGADLYYLLPSTREQAARLYRQPLAGGEAQLLLKLSTLYAQGGFGLTPDGAVFFTGVVRNDSDLKVVESQAPVFGQAGTLRPIPASP